MVAKWPLFSAFFGWLQNRPSSKPKIMPFIKRFGIDTSEFLESPEEYCTFNEFFIRKLKPEARPINPSPAVIPADGRYKFFQEISSNQEIEVKNRSLCLKAVLQDETLANRYEGGSLVIARLCPTDCHRFYFPIDSVPSKARCINGLLYSVNPLATKDNPWIWGANRRMLTILSSDTFDDVAFLEVGATNVGTIIETYQPGKFQPKGAEKGYFSFGGSALLIFFKKGRIRFDQDLLDASSSGLEIKCLIGESMGSLRT
jgi:phosphatidylserine decarboxylase